jgi:hypothetical protein
MENPSAPKARGSKPWPLWKKLLLAGLVIVGGIFLFSLLSVTRQNDKLATLTAPEFKKFAPAATLPELSVARKKAEGGDKGLNFPVSQSGAGEDEITATFASLDNWGRQIIREGSMTLEVRDVRAAFERVQTLAGAKGALITDANLEAASGSSDKVQGYSRATLVLRIPQSRFDGLRRDLRNLAGDLKGRVLHDSLNSQDVTEEYVDLSSRLRHEQAQEAQLLEIMRQARKISDILAVRNELSSVQQEIERIQGRLRYLANRVDLSTLTVEIVQKGKSLIPAQPTLASAWKQMGKNLNAAWSKTLQNSVALIGFLIMALIYLLPLALLAGIVWLVVRIGRRRLISNPKA